MCENGTLEITNFSYGMTKVHIKTWLWKQKCQRFVPCKKAWNPSQANHTRPHVRLLIDWRVVDRVCWLFKHKTILVLNDKSGLWSFDSLKNRSARHSFLSKNLFWLTSKIDLTFTRQKWNTTTEWFANHSLRPLFLSKKSYFFLIKEF